MAGGIKETFGDGEEILMGTLRSHGGAGGGKEKGKIRGKGR